MKNSILFTLTIIAFVIAGIAATIAISYAPPVQPQRNEQPVSPDSPGHSGDPGKSRKHSAREQIDNPHLHDFGEVDRGTMLTHTFDIVNDGNEPTELKIEEVSCSCTTANLASPHLGVGATTQLVMTLDSNKAGAVSGETTVLLSPQGIKVPFAVRAFVKGATHVIPEILDFSEVQLGQRLTATLTFLFYVGDGERVDFLSLDAHEMSLSVIKVTQHTEKVGYVNRITYRVQVAFDVQESLVSVKGKTVEFLFDQEGHQRRIGVEMRADFASLYEIRPDRWFIAHLTKTNESPNRSITLRFNRPNIQIAAIQCDYDGITVTYEMESDGTYTLTLKTKDTSQGHTALSWPLVGFVTIEVNSTDMLPIKIPFTILSRMA